MNKDEIMELSRILEEIGERFLGLANILEIGIGKKNKVNLIEEDIDAKVEETQAKIKSEKQLKKCKYCGGEFYWERSEGKWTPHHTATEDGRCPNYQ